MYILYYIILSFFIFWKIKIYVIKKKKIDCPFSDRAKKETPLVLETKKAHDKTTANIDGGDDSMFFHQTTRTIYNSPKV